MARDAIARKTRHAQVGRARNNPFLACGKRHVGVAAGNHIIHRQKILAAAADRPAVHRGDPGLFSRPSVNFVGACRARRNPTEHLVHHPHVAADVPEIGNLAVVDMSEIDPARKNLAAFVFRMIDDTAAQYTDLAQWVDDRDIGGRFGIAERVIILGIEETRILHRYHGRLALPFEAGWPEIDHPVSDEFVHPRDRFLFRAQHRFAQVHSGFRKRERVRQENPLVDLDAIFFTLH